jgi:hypothetical protein
MNGWIGITDNERFAFIGRERRIDDVNLRLPEGKNLLDGLRP